MLEDAGLLATETEENMLHDGREWRSFYWILNKSKVFETVEESKKTVQVEPIIYETLDDAVWQREPAEPELTPAITDLKKSILKRLKPVPHTSTELRKPILERFDGKITLEDLLVLNDSEFDDKIVNNLTELSKKIGEKRGRLKIRGKEKMEFIINVLRERPLMSSVLFDNLFGIAWETQFKRWNDARREAGLEINEYKKPALGPDKEKGRRIILDYIKEKFMEFKNREDRRPEERVVCIIDVQKKFNTDLRTYFKSFSEARKSALIELIEADISKNLKITKGDIEKTYGVILYWDDFDFYAFKRHVLGRPWGRRIFENKEQVKEETIKYIIDRFKAVDEMVLKLLYQGSVEIDGEDIPMKYISKLSTESAFDYGIKHKDVYEFLKIDSNSITTYLGTPVQNWGLSLPAIKAEANIYVPELKYTCAWFSRGDFTQVVYKLVEQKQPTLLSELNEELCSMIEKKIGRELTLEERKQKFYCSLTGIIGKLVDRKEIKKFETTSFDGKKTGIYFIKEEAAALKRAEEMKGANAIYVNNLTVPLGSETLRSKVYGAVSNFNKAGVLPRLRDILDHMKNNYSEYGIYSQSTLHNSVRTTLRELKKTGVIAAKKTRPKGYRSDINLYFALGERRGETYAR